MPLLAESLTMLEWMTDHWAALAITITCLSIGILGTLILTKYVRICLNIFCDTPPPLSMNPVDFQRLEGEVVRFRSFDGTSLRGMLLRPPRGVAYKGTIVFCHEYGSDMWSCARYTRPLLEHGYRVFTFDFRAHGESSGHDYKPLQWPSDKELGDVLGACAHVEEMLQAEGLPHEIGLFGISRGAGSALLAACSDPNVKAIVCDGAFSTDTTLIALMKRWAHIFASISLVYKHNTESFWRFLVWLLMRFAQPKLRRRFPSVRKAIRDLKDKPIFFIHGKKDSYIREEQTRLLYEVAPGPKYMWVVDGAKHNQAAVVSPREYKSRTTAFFDRYLAEEDVSEEQINTGPADVGAA